MNASSFDAFSSQIAGPLAIVVGLCLAFSLLVYFLRERARDDARRVRLK